MRTVAPHQDTWPGVPAEPKDPELGSSVLSRGCCPQVCRWAKVSMSITRSLHPGKAMLRAPMGLHLIPADSRLRTKASDHPESPIPCQEEK